MSALTGVRVIDFGHYAAGPAAGMLLADQGAEVIKVDPPTGPVFDHIANRTWNRGKKSICLDLKAESDQRIARDLIQSADVVIENFRPGVMAKWGLGVEQMTELNPALVYLAMPGFAASDKRAEMPAWESIIQAALDAVRPKAKYRDMIQSLHTKPLEREGELSQSHEPIASMYAALLGSTAVTAALIERMNTGQGDYIELPLFDALLQGIGIYGLSLQPFTPIQTPIFDAWDHQYQCADGRYVHITMEKRNGLARFIEAVDKPQWLSNGYLEDGLVQNAELNGAAIIDLTELFKTKTAAQWQALFVELEVPGAACLSIEEWFEHPQAQGSDLLVSLQDPVLGETQQPGVQVKLSATPGAVTTAAPMLDQHHDEILADLEANKKQKPVLPSAPHAKPFKGLKVLDLCIVLAGPTCGRTFAELGADVIKIDQPGRNNFPYHLDINRGKRSLLMDWKTPEGKAILLKLIDQADIVVQNFRQGVVEKLGIDYETLKTRKPDIIYVSLNAYGDNGPWAHLPGYEELAEAITGMQHQFGGDTPYLWPYGVVCDYGTGYAGAYAALLALYHRNQTGEGQHVSSALARTSCTLQSLNMQQYKGKDWQKPLESCLAYEGILACTDGKVMVASKQLQCLKNNLNLAEGASSESLADALADFCASRTMAGVCNALASIYTGVQSLDWIVDVMAGEATVNQGLSITRFHDGLTDIRTVGPGHWFKNLAYSAGAPVPLVGTDAVSVLGDINQAEELAALVESGTIHLPTAVQSRYLEDD